MGNLIKPSDVKLVAKDGELHIHLTLDLNLNLNGLTPAKTPSEQSVVIESSLPEKEKNNWSVPDFGNIKGMTGKLKFGKDSDEEESQE